MSDSGFEDLARGALLDVTDARSVGPLVSEQDEGDGVVTLRFESNLPGYLGWKWAVSVAKIGDAAPTVLESELVPGDGALLAPEWVPWSDRLDEFNAGRAAEAGSDEETGDEDELVDEEDLVDEEFDGDDEYDGVDVDAVLGDPDEDEGEDDDDYDDLGESDVDDDPETDEESDAAAVGVEEPEDAEGDAGDAGPDQARLAGSADTADAEQQADERQ